MVLINKRPKLPNGGVPLPNAENGSYQFDPPRTFSACKAVTLGDSLDGCSSDPKKIVVKLHLNRGHVSAHQFKWVSADSDGDNPHSLTCVDAYSGQCEVCRA